MPDRPVEPIDPTVRPAFAPPAAAAVLRGEDAPASDLAVTGGNRPWLIGVAGMVAALIVASVVLRVLMRVVDLPASAGAHVVPVGIAVVGLVLAAGWVRRGVRRQVADGVAAKVAEFGGGLYGSIAFATLLYLEALDIVGEVVAAGSIGGFVGGLSFAWLMAQMMESIGFFVTSITWPWYWLSELGPAVAGIVAGAVWAVSGVGGRVWTWFTDRRAARTRGVAAAEEIP